MTEKLCCLEAPGPRTRTSGRGQLNPHRKCGGPGTALGAASCMSQGNAEGAAASAQAQARPEVPALPPAPCVCEAPAAAGPWAAVQVSREAWPWKIPGRLSAAVNSYHGPRSTHFTPG